MSTPSGYTWEIKNQLGHVVEALFFSPDDVTPMPANDEYPKGYYIVQVKISADEIKRIGD